MIFWGPVVGLWITQVIAFGPVCFDLFRIQNWDLTQFLEKDSGFNPGCHILGTQPRFGPHGLEILLLTVVTTASTLTRSFLSPTDHYSNSVALTILSWLGD